MNRAQTRRLSTQRPTTRRTERKRAQIGLSNECFAREFLDAFALIGALLAFGMCWAALEGRAAAAASPYPELVSRDPSQEADSSAETEHPGSDAGAGPSAPPAVSAAAPADALPRASVWLVDGYNVLHAGLLNREDRSHFWSAPHRERLRSRAECFGAGADEIWLVFDGQRPDEQVTGQPGGPRIHTLFAPSADEWLVRRIRADARPEELAVVTGDRQVADRARHRGARVVSPRLFLAHCGGEDPDRAN